MHLFGLEHLRTVSKIQEAKIWTWIMAIAWYHFANDCIDHLSHHKWYALAFSLGYENPIYQVQLLHLYAGGGKSTLPNSHFCHWYWPCFKYLQWEKDCIKVWTSALLSAPQCMQAPSRFFTLTITWISCAWEGHGEELKFDAGQKRTACRQRFRNPKLRNQAVKFAHPASQSSFDNKVQKFCIDEPAAGT